MGIESDDERSDLEHRLVDVLRLGLPPGQTTDTLLRELAEPLGWQAAALWMPDRPHRAIIGVGAWEQGGTTRFVTDTNGATLPVASSTVGRCWASAEAIWVDDVARQPGLYRRDLLVESGFHTLLFLPILAGPEAIGVMELLASEPLERQQRDVDGTQRVLSDITGLLRGHLAAEQSRVQRRRHELALAAGAMGSWEWDRRTGFVGWSSDMEELYGFERGTFPGTLEAYRSRIHPDDREESERALRKTLQTGDLHHVLNRVILPDGEIRWIEGHGHPLYDDRGELAGLTGVSKDVTERVGMVDLLAHQVQLTEEALAERSLVADTLQRSLLPAQLPDVDGLDLASGFRAGQELVGGDFFQVFCHGPDIYLVLGDVCGKGPEAAAVTGLARFAIRGMVAANMRKPAQILDRLNSVLLEEPDVQRFVTLVLVRLTRTGGGFRAVVCRAGHPLPAVKGSQGQVRLLQRQKGMLVGALPQIELREQTVVLGPGDSLVLYTDGVTETRRGDEQFGEQRLLATLAAAPDDAPGMVDALLAAVNEFDAGHAPDDVAVLVATVT